MSRPKGSKNKKKPEETIESSSTTTIIHDFGDDLPKRVELDVTELDKTSGYDYTEQGRYWSNGREIVCIVLLSKHK